MPSRSGRARGFAIERTGTTGPWRATARLHAPGINGVRLGNGLHRLSIWVAAWGVLLEVWGLSPKGLLFGVVTAFSLKLHDVPENPRRDGE